MTHIGNVLSLADSENSTHEETGGLSVCRAWLMSRGSSIDRGNVTQGKPVVASMAYAAGIAAGKTRVAYIHNQRQYCVLSEDRHGLVVTHNLDL